MRRILVVGQDERALSHLLRPLQEEGFAVSLCLPDSDDLSAIQDDPPDVLILDLTAAGEGSDLQELLRQARQRERPAVLGLVSREQLPHLDPALGLDDFLVGTASPAELSARVRHLLWKRARIDSQNLLQCGDLVMDLANYKVYLAGRPVELTYKEYELLRFLASNRDRVFSRETLLNKVWGYDFYGGARTVDVHIRRLRAKIEDRHHAFIETVRNVGYRFRASR